MLRENSFCHIKAKLFKVKVLRRKKAPKIEITGRIKEK
jgi:predicted nucleotide-binding protein (sugar kinase/HSP70/actin superfamily)